ALPAAPQAHIEGRCCNNSRPAILVSQTSASWCHDCLFKPALKRKQSGSRVAKPVKMSILKTKRQTHELDLTSGILWSCTPDCLDFFCTECTRKLRVASFLFFHFRTQSDSWQPKPGFTEHAKRSLALAHREVEDRR